MSELIVTDLVSPAYPTEVLLIGGPYHGERTGTSSIVSDIECLSPGEEPPGRVYAISQVIWKGMLYRVGRFDPTTEQTAEIGTLIDSTGLKPTGPA